MQIDRFPGVTLCSNLVFLCCIIYRLFNLRASSELFSLLSYSVTVSLCMSNQQYPLELPVVCLPQRLVFTGSSNYCFPYENNMSMERISH